MFPSCYSKPTEASNKRSSVAKLLLGVFVVYMLHSAWLLHGFYSTKACDKGREEHCITSYLTAKPRIQVALFYTFDIWTGFMSIPERFHSGIKDNRLSNVDTPFICCWDNTLLYKTYNITLIIFIFNFLYVYSIWNPTDRAIQLMVLYVIMTTSIGLVFFETVKEQIVLNHIFFLTAHLLSSVFLLAWCRTTVILNLLLK